ncbi:zinc finger protein 469 [Epinephelus fuscoguttatus]|uniref:zinc finger protein 469 n=1 Tax=Epinephelus fuscoguttatus TaxID=293821 RepID=UPI0020D1EAFB|nr:zinc finger protein 469 [Epinephelus fuscoguttatus]XP_049429642.1 zinc finger protein 469 [Epinephelus fuscoguttatus]XP_049429643.1 zinc finger protein 469 [Epinephelus fuscoguttatus]XP_049429644.1 zinc finger protein 469 [Epinephelus fuscoguttatus]XP_049429645.1 zinc finger protein 469 [Epinephelus fuscoguttatus]XP_049429646.1 zinc finger protein 469 [Epinephelus fuscoguttatus]XP_049429647.1 zinc finger protein 469 [Epinephelus fuscoguttatus]
MAGETQRLHAVKELAAESKLQDEGTALEQQSDKTTKESSEHFSSTGTEARASGREAKVEKLEKRRDCPQQREAVIRPQQTGKIDFRSLQNRSKFATDRTWSSGKGSPQSPSGKGRSREKGKRSGKTERGNPQQLYRLSITNPRSNPTIGIAYPQQKVAPPKKLETSRGPVSGSYRFHVPSIPEREAELQQEELNYSRCFQEASSNLTSPSYTSQALGSSSGTSSHPHPPLSQQQQPASMENNSTQPGSQLILADFQLSGSNVWQSPERTFNGANYGVSSQKSTALTEANKANSFVPGPFQYGYHFLEESTSDSFPCEQNPQSQDFTDSSLGSVHVTHNSFSFPSGEGQNIAQNSTQFSNEQQSDERSSYSQPPQFIQGVTSSIQCPRNLSEDSASSDSSGSSSQQSEQGKAALPESTDTIAQADSRDAAITSGSKRNCHPKDTAANQRTLIQGSVHHTRNISGPGSQMHFPSKTFNNPPVSNIHTGSMPFDKNISNKVLNRLPHSWEGPNKTYSPADQNTVQYSDMNDKFQFQNQPALDQRPNSSKNSRMPWQQIRPTPAMPNQNRIELSRQISSQKLAYMVSPTDWQDDSKSHKHGSLKNPSSFQNSRTSDGFSNQRQETVKHSSNTVSTFKVEMSHTQQVCESKNKAVYFGLNQSLPAAAPSRNYSYPPLQVPPMGLMMVSPYESPLPSPVHNPASSSTCSSLSPASTSPVNISSEDGQMSKSAPSHPFYHQPQAKAQLPSDHLSSHPHQFHSDAPRNLPYAPDRAKDDMMSYLQNSTHPKPTMDANKGYMDSFGVEHHQPPPPYSAHQLLASSLAAANLDQLDVLLTCKQCDQNFNNLASFLGHKQYCAQHTFAQNDLKDISKMEDGRKFHAEPAKAVSSGSNVSMSRCPSDLHLSLLGLNKNGELISDSETKGDNKDDPMKLSLFSGTGNLPVPLPELEMEDAKLDSLITEALNGLGYQSDNAEIDSSFIDAFADDDLTTVKATSNKQCLKAKESLVFESKNKQAAEDDRSFTQGKYFYDSDVENPETDKQYTESKLEKISLNLEQDEKINIKKEVSHKNSRSASREKTREQDNKVKETRKLCKSEDENTSTQRFLLSSKFSERCGVKSFQDSSALRGSTPSQASTSPTSRTAVKESKRKSTGGGTWSKELIHKIVQQKNKLHKLHVKGTKNLQFSLVMERLTPTVQNPAFGEYDYVSDSDDECEPVKIASQGRLNQSSRCKYTYTKECKWRARSERDQAAWRHESKECFEVKKSEEVSLSPEKHGSHQRLRRRGSRSSTSSELSTSVSVSSDSINSPKSIDRTDSDCEKKTDIKKKESPEQKTYERSSPQKLCKESSTLALTFTKSVKKYNTDKAILSDNKDSPEDPKKNHVNPEVADPVSSSQKAKDTVRNSEKGRGSHTKSREKLVSPRKEAVSSDRNTLQRTDKLCPKEEPSQCSSTESKPLQIDSHSPTINKETDFNIDNTKGKRSEGPQATQPELSDSTTFEKQNDGVCVVKEAITLVNDLDAHKPASLCTSLMDEVCLSPTESQGPLIQKDTLHLMPYPLDQEQGLLKSPLSFDTSSMFGDLAGFDSGLYSDMPIQKDGFHSIESTTDKKEEFVSSFSPFLEQRDWNLIVSPVLPDEISQYKGNSEKSNEKKPDYNHVPLSLPEKIIDYSGNLNSCVSEDELEIKRIVNELENQLQTTKLESPPLLAQDDPKQLKMSKFSPLRLGDESESESTGLDIRCPVQTIDVPVTSLPSEPFTEPWSSPFQFELISGHHSPHTPIHSESGALEHFTEKEHEAPNLITTAPHIEHTQLHGDQKSVEINAKKETAAETKEEILEQKRYTENLMKSLEVISDSIFKKEPIISEHKEPNVTSLMSQQHQEIECQTTDAVEREDHSEKEAITGKENILSPPNINERKDDIEFILNESQSSLSNSTDPTVDGNQPISSQPSEPTENNDSKAETKVTSEEDITENSNLIQSTRCSSVATHDLHVVEESCGNSNAIDNVNQLFKNCSDGPEQSTTDGYEEAEAVKGITGQSVSHPLSPALPAASLDIGEKIQGAIKTTDEEQSTDNLDNAGDISSSGADELKVECSDIVNEEITVETAERDHLIGLSPSKNCSPAKTSSSTTDLSVEIVTTDKPCSPILVETNTENHCSPFRDTQSTEGQSNLLILSQSDGIIDSDSCKVAPFNDSLKPEASLAFQKQEEILDVQDIKEHLPIDFMASHQNSPCREEGEESHCLFLHTAPPTSPLLSASHQTPMQKWNIEEDSQSKCGDMSVKQGSVPNTLSPINKKENSNVKEAVNTEEQLSTAAEIEYSLISPPPLDLGIIECKIPSSETTIPSPLPVTSTAEPPQASDGLEKRDPMYDFKLSPLNYNSIPDEPPQLNQYDYIPISPASKPEENPDIKQSPRNDCGPCDLSVNPALIFNQTETDTAVSLSSNPAARLNLSDESLVLQQGLKFSCFSLGLPPEIKSKDSSTCNAKADLEVCHGPAEPVENLHIHADLLRKDESENLDSHEASAEDSTLIRKDISDGPPTPKPLVICENEQMPLPPDLSEKQPTIATGQCSTTHQVQKETTQKKTQNNAQQGKELCEICLMCFRTVPGLKRHKAMKHLVRSEKQIGPQSTTSSHQGTVLIYEASQTTEQEHKNDSQTCYPTKIDRLPETSSTLISKAAETESVLEEMPTETNVVAVGEIGHHNPLLPTKAKKNSKARKNKNSEANMKPDPFSDELLNILKTDILQAITPDFKSSGPQELRKSPADQVKTSDRTVTRAETFPHSITSNSGSDNAPQSPTKDINVLNETVELNQITDMEEIKCTSMTEMANGEVCTDNNVETALSVDKDIIREYDEPRKSLCAVEEMCEQTGSEQSLAQEILRKVAAVEIKCEKNGGPSDTAHPLSCLNCSPISPPGISPDLKALLDDDTTFSQLFPRDEDAKRKKCPRVYSKRNKRQKLSPDSNVTQDCPPSETFMQSKDVYMKNQAEQTFTDSQTNRCEYETISIDDAIMLNMCHNSTLKSDVKELTDVKQSDQQDVHESIKETGNSPSNPLESTVDKSTIEWSGSSDFSSFDAGSAVTSDPSICKTAEPTTPCPVPPPSASFTMEPNAPKSAQTFHSIDIQNINTTFQLPEIQFFDPKKDISVAPPIATVDVENKDDEKSKKVTERRGRKRQVGGIKVKDKQYKCKVCFTWFLTLGELNFHKLSHNPSPPPTCYMCVQRKFSSREQLRDHLREKHAKNKTGIWTCGMCLKEISDVWMYNEHLREHATQFARRGQTQGSMLGIPGCFMQETAVKNFITSIMQHRPSKANRESSKATKEQEKAAATESTVGEGKTSEGAEPKVHKTKSSSGAGGKQSTLTPLEVLHKTETPKSVEMHPNCKDPSRDCHHCGKQFPKPFKLQRHLVVHNLEKIFLCHKCPVSYQEAQELKGHLKRAHEEVDELDSKHTTLYTCELCADVMHVIKKSFICSTCNYTFSKKEQFDRHMEKHLSGGNKIFKFRGVLRPVKASASKEDECDSPASKKRRILSDSLQENSSDSGIASVSSLHLNQNSDSSKPSVSTADDSTQTIANEYHSDTNDTNVKTEDIAEDYSELLVELEKCIHMDSSESASPKKEEIDPTTSLLLDKEGNGKSITEPHDVKEENESVCIRAETTSWSAPKESSNAGEETVKAEEGSAEGGTAETEKETDSLPPKEDAFISLGENQIISKTPESKQELAADVTDQQRDDEQWHHTSKASNNDSKQLTLSQGAEQEGSSQMKDKVSPAKTTENTKNGTTAGSTKATESTPVLHSKASLNASASNEDKESVRPQKKRKDMKSPHSLQRVSSPATQENFGVDSRAKKKFRPSKCANTSLQRKSDGPNDYPVLSSVRDDVVSNKIISKCKTSNLGLQSKRNLLDNCTQKKAEIVTPLNGDYKAKKGPLGRPLHPPISKVSSVPMNNSLNKSRPKMGVRSMESHSYRTAESQNHLLSQLFGQKLTSFKIPLRKDTSESIN